MANELEHRPSSVRKGKSKYCMRCGVTWPCLAAHERAQEIQRAQKRGRGKVRCRQCEREVDITKFAVDQGRCRECVAAGNLLSRHWKLIGIPIRSRTI